MRLLAIAVFFAATLASAQPFISSVECVGNRGTKVSVQVDVLESNPPQSSISITFFDGRKTGFSAFTQYLTLESFPPIDQWTWKADDGSRTVSVSRREGEEAAKGYLSIERMLPEELNCELK